MRMMRRSSERLRESYLYTVHKSGLPIYVFPKELTTTYALFATRYGAQDVAFRPQGEREWTQTPAGVAHFLEHKLFDNADGSDSFERFSALGADANAYTSCNRTAYLFSCTEHFEESLTELLRFVTAPYFTPETVQKEQGIIAEEIRMYDDQPWERCFQNLMDGMYQAHPVRTSICGTVESIAQISPALLYKCYEAFYAPWNMALVVCGNVDPERVLAIADAVLPNAEQVREVERFRPFEPEAVVRPYAAAQMQVSKPIFSIGIKDSRIPTDPTARTRRDAAMSLLEELLFSRAGPFYSSLFEEGLLTPSYSYGYSIAEDFGFHTVSGESDDPKEIARRLWAYLQKVKREGIDPADFARCKRVLYADEIRGYDSTEEIANNLLTFVFDESELLDYPEVLESIGQDELVPLLGEMLREDAFCLSVIEPLGQNERR